MGKSTKRPAQGPKPPTNVAKPAADSLPAFDEKALLSLTKKIEKGFGSKKNPENKPENQGQPKKTAKNAAPTQQSKNKNHTKEEPKQGNKRDARGNRKPASNESTKNNGPKKLQNGNGKADSDVLLQEILALGGTEEDLQLVADALSDDEDLDESSTAAPDKSFKADLAKFVAGLGIDTTAEQDASESEPEEGNDDEWESSGDESLDEPALSAKVQRTGSTKGKQKVEESSPEPSRSEVPGRLIFEARPDWHAAPLASLPDPDSKDSSFARNAIANLKEYANSLLEADSTLYASKHLSSSSSHRFLSTIMSSGTLSDKVSALTLVVQESPLHTAKSFDSLLGMAKKRSRGQAISALGALKDLLAAGVVLPSDRRLRSFAAQPGLLGTLQSKTISSWTSGQKLPGKITKAHLISWAYEDWLKETYFEMLQVLEGWCNDEVEYARSRAVNYVYELLKEKPEQESNLLRLLVNKLGDPDKKIAARTSQLLLQLQTSHPLMKSIIIRSIETELLLRPGQSSHAKYYAINTLNQTILSGKEENIAGKLLSIYFDLFVTLLKKPDVPKEIVGPALNRKGQLQGGGGPAGKMAKSKASKEEEAKKASEETTEKMISAVLMGVNRAFPFSKEDSSTLEKHMDTLFKITHSSNFNTSVQALMLIEQLATAKHLAVDRFYKTLYESLLDPRLITSSKHALYLNLLFRAVRSDVNIKRVKAFAKRMLQIITLHQPPFICGVLYLLSELKQTFPGLKSLFNDPEDDGQDDEVFRDVPEDGGPADQDDELPVKRSSDTYDGRKRDPEYSNADKSCVWESIPFLVHFHPSVSMFASRLIQDEKMPPKPDLASHSLINFLDRFVYRNAKTAATSSRGDSIMQPLSGGDSRVLVSSRAAQKKHESLNSEAFWNKKAEDVSVDEVFFHKYFSHIGKGKQAASKKKPSAKREGSEDEENEDEIWQALVDSRPEVEGGSDDESDMEMLDLDDSDAPSSIGDDDEGDSGLEGLEEDADDKDLEDDEWDDASDADDVNELFEKELKQAQPPDENIEEGPRQKKRRLKNLPTFASVEDYAEMLDNDDDEDL